MNESSTDCNNFACTTEGLVIIIVPSVLLLLLLLIIIYFKKKNKKCPRPNTFLKCIKKKCLSRKIAQVIPSYINESTIIEKSQTCLDASTETKANLNEKEITDLDHSVHYDMSYIGPEKLPHFKELEPMAIPITANIDVMQPIQTEILGEEVSFHEEEKAKEDIVINDLVKNSPEVTFRDKNIEKIQLTEDERIPTKGTDVEIRMNTYLKTEFSDDKETLSNHEEQESDINITNEMLYGDRSPQETVRVVSELTSTSIGYFDGDTPRKISLPGTARSNQSEIVKNL